MQFSCSPQHNGASGRRPPGFADLISGGIHGRLAEVQQLLTGFSEFKRALPSDLEVYRSALAQPINPFERNSLMTGIVRTIAEAAIPAANSSPVPIEMVRSVADFRLVVSPSFPHLIGPCPRRLIVCAKCGQEMAARYELPAGDEAVPAYPQCQCVVMDWVVEVSHAGLRDTASSLPTRVRTRPRWLRGTFKGGRRGDGIPAALGSLRVFQGRKG
jgi:hypothetical protein